MINVVIGIITYEDKILLIKRERGDFIGLYGYQEEKSKNVSI